jgi:carboxyl-terminal processing protease
MTRAILKLPPVESKLLPDEIGYIKIMALSEPQVKETATALADLQKQGAKRMILDLRYCATGEPEVGIDLANLFLDKGLISYVQGQKYPRKDFNAAEKKDVSNLPLVVLTNRGTASGAEIAAGALQADKRARVVGERTYGDASVRQPITMDDGSAIILSIAKYYTPEGKSIQDNGITPNEQVVEAEAALGDSDDDADNTQQPGAAPKKPGPDTILQKGIDVVKKQS